MEWVPLPQNKVEMQFENLFFTKRFSTALTTLFRFWRSILRVHCEYRPRLSSIIHANRLPLLFDLMPASSSWSSS